MRLIFFLLIIISCQNRNEASFINLEDAFIDWYYKQNPSLSTIQGWNINNNLINQYNSDDINEKLEDINRFKIELSQIDETKISKKQLNRFFKLSTILDYLILEIDINRNSNYNILDPLSSSYAGLFYLLYISDITMEERVDALSNRLEGLANQLLDISNNIICIDKYQQEIFIYYYSCFNTLLDDIPINIYSDNITLDKIDKFINTGRKALDMLESNINKEYSSSCSNRNSRNIYLRNFIPNDITTESLNIKLDSIIVDIKNDIFNLSLSKYVQNNDEPIWVDYDDTLNVINAILPTIFNSNIDNEWEMEIVDYS